MQRIMWVARATPGISRAWPSALRQHAPVAPSKAPLQSLSTRTAEKTADLFPELPEESPGGLHDDLEVSSLYDRYKGLDSTQGVLSFASALRTVKPAPPAPLPEVKKVRATINHSRHKVNDICRLIRGLSAHEAMVQLHFSQKRIADEIKRALAAAIKTATRDRKLDEDRLVVSQAFVGRNTPLVRVRYHSQSRMGRVNKPRTRLTIVLSEVPHGDPRAVGRIVSHRSGHLPQRPRWAKLH
jgi:large subunit ribosomal protein L22